MSSSINDWKVVNGWDFFLPIGVQINSNIKKAYLYAKGNKEFLINIPCTCGCDELGHTSNYDCYFKQDGSYNDHGTYCGGCIGITLDAARMISQGESIEEIRE